MAIRANDGPDDDGVDRRGFIKCMAWAGTGLLWTMRAGVPASVGLSEVRRSGLPAGFRGELFFAQLSDSHIGFSKEANPDVTATLQDAIARLNGLERRPAFVLHTGDISHLSKPTEFDTADQVLRTLKTDRIHFVPGEHDVLTDDGEQYLERYGKGSKGSGWYSFDQHGVHFVGLVNVVNLQAGGLGALGAAQLAWLARDLQRLSASTPIVVFAHIPLWSVYPEWGWGTDDAEQALTMLRRFGSVTVLNGHIHQTLQKVEGNVTFHTALSTAFPQPAPGAAPSPGPMKVEPGRLRSLLGIASVELKTNPGSLAIVDQPLAKAATGGDGAATNPANGDPSVRIDNFAFQPASVTVAAGAPVTWHNGDDVPHKIVSADQQFAPSPVLDTNDHFTARFAAPGAYRYFCALHPKMVGTVVVTR